MTRLVATLFVLFGLFQDCIAQGIGQDSLIIRTFSSREYRASTYNYSAFEDENGIMYFANENGLLEYDGSQWKLTKIADHTGVTIIKQGPDGRIYVGGVNEFGYLERNKEGNLIYFSLRKDIDPDLEIREIWQILFINNEVFFQSYESLVRFDGEVSHNIDVKDSWMLNINDKMYITTYDKGLSYIDNDSIIQVDNGFQLKNDAPFKLLPGPDSLMIAITEYNGLFLFDSTTFEFKKWEIEANENLAKHGLYDAIVWDDSTYLFARTNNGLAWVSKEGKLIRELTKEDGLSSKYPREMWKDSRGNLWVTSDGLNYITFPEIATDDNFNTLIRSIEINDSTALVNSSSGQFQLAGIEIVNSIVFNFATPGFDRTELEYSYYLEGHDESWSPWRDNVKKEYTNLVNGEYVFHVKARLHNGKTSIPASISIKVPQLWYKTPWAYVLALLIIVASIWAVIRLRTRQLKNLNRRLELIIDNRTQELVKQKEQLHGTNEELTLANTELDNFVYRSSHDLVAPLKSLKGLISIAKLEPSQDKQEEYFNMMNTSVNKLEDFIKSILEYSSNSNKEVEFVPVKLANVIDNIDEDLKYFGQIDKVTFLREFDPDLTLNSDPKRLKIIISNLIANAIKYHNYSQPKPFINIGAEKDKGVITIKIFDNGQGIEESHLENIFNMFYRASENSQGSGLGLYIVKDTVSKLNGQISVESTISKGTTFTIRFPH